MLLDSIAAQSDYNIDFEIAISDNGSNDGTQALIETYKSAGMNIRYDRLETNQGFDRNLINVVNIATGDYCWLFGSDDIMEPGAFSGLEKTLQRHPSAAGISIGLQAYTSDLTERIFINDHISTDFSSETVLSGRGTIIATIGACFGFMSSVVVRRELWLQALAHSSVEPYLKGYVHTYLVARMLDETSQWVCLPTRLVGYRTGNDSFSSVDEFARTKLDIVCYDLAFGDTLGRNHWAYKKSMTMIAVFPVGVHFLNAKLQGASSAYWRQAIPTTVSYYWRYPGFWFKTFPIALIPSRVLIFARSIYRGTLKDARQRQLKRKHHIPS